MRSALFEKLGLANLDLGIILILITVVIIVLLILLISTMTKLSRMTKKYYFFMRGKEAKSLESEIMKLFEDNRQMKEEIARNTKDIRSIYKQLRLTYQKMGLVKYDAFSQMGGKLSFCLALLDQDNNGFLINSVHGTDSSYSYIKRIESGSCRMDLTNEEKAALTKAVQGELNEAD
ncbi:MAG: DUF4446 family protein [Lachnospiraceae bacterium]|nr:DUF4446 family protein [Lachnospiraceae bacterium]